MNDSLRISSPPRAPSQRALPWLLALFVGSGCAALIYEIVWLQLLQLVIGLTNVSLGVLLGTYMGGMCLGSLLLPRFVSARRHPLRVYALLELGIGAIGIAILFVVPWIAQIYTESSGRGLPGILLRGIVAALCLLPPTVLMGATLPAMARWVEATPSGVSWLGFFYGGNIAGAVFGCLLAGFYLLRVFDMATATYVAASINVTVALTGLLLAARFGSHSTERTAAMLVENAVPDSTLPRSDGRSNTVGAAAGHKLVYVAIALSGLAALGAEIVWTRLLSLILGGTVYTFSIILAVFLAGLGIGSSIGAFLSRSVIRPRVAFGLCQLLLATAIAWTAYAIAHSLPYWPIDPSLSRSPWLTFQLDMARCLWAILPAAILWGASFPLALASAASPARDPGRLVGGVYAANTVGAIVGALLFSLLLVPRFGTQTAERMLIGLSSLAAILALMPRFGDASGTSSNKLRGEMRETGALSAVFDAERAAAPLRRWANPIAIPAAILMSLALAAWLTWAVSPAPWGIMAYGRFMATYGERLAPRLVSENDVPSGAHSPDIYCTYVGEGLNGSIAVTKWTSGVRNFHSAGKVQASNEPHDMRLQRMLGHISALANSKPESVLVVACGAGVTAGSFVVHPETKRIVICDIEPLVPKFVAPMFAKENYDVVNDPRTEVVLDDGRHFIRTTKEKFDVITSDPIDPWVKGCAALNTVDYYQMCKDHLKPGGVMSLWIPLYESNLDSAKSVIATFFKVFPNGILWHNDNDGEGYDAVLFGQAEPTRIDIGQWQERLNREDHAKVKQSLKEVGFNTAVALLSTYAGQAQDLQEWMRDAQINTDRNLRLQYLAGMWLNTYRGSEIIEDIIRYRRFPDKVFVGSEQNRQMLRMAIEGAGTSAERLVSPPKKL